jgi:DegV family protein with EDD domain
MARVAVVTDSTASLTEELIRRHEIGVISLYVVFGGDRTVRESDLTDSAAFFEELRTADTLPTTSQPSVGDFLSVYEPILAEGRDVVSLHISGGLSGTPEAARQAALALERDGKGGDRIRVIDSESAAGGLGLVTLAAATAAERGLELDDVEATARHARRELKMWFAVDTLEFLRRGGRIGAASAWIGSTLKVKPILTLEREMVPVERVRTSRRMLDRLVEYGRQRHESGADAWAVQHINAPDQCDLLVERCREVFGCEPQLVSEIGPVLGAHVGPGLLGLGSIPARFTD